MSGKLYLYSFKYGSPAAPTVLSYLADVNHLRDPIGQKDLIKACKDGRDPLVLKWIAEDTRLTSLVDQLNHLANIQLRAAEQTAMSVGFTDCRGQWIAPACVRLLHVVAEKSGIDVVPFYLGLT